MTAEQPETVEEEIKQLDAAHLLACNELAERLNDLSMAQSVTNMAMTAATDAGDVKLEASNALQNAFARKVQAMVEAQS